MKNNCDPNSAVSEFDIKEEKNSNNSKTVEINWCDLTFFTVILPSLKIPASL